MTAADPDGSSPPDANDVAAPSAGLSRRRVLVGAAGVGAAVWAAPAILSVDAVAAATCLPFVLDFSLYETQINALGNAPGTSSFTIGGPGFDVEVTYDASQPDGIAATEYAPGTSGGKVDNFIQLELSNDNHGVVGDHVQLRFQFIDQGVGNPFPVSNLSFTLLDIDQSPAVTGLSWRDLVEVEAYAASTFVRPATVTPGTLPAQVVHVPVLVPPSDQVGPQLLAGPADPSSAAGNAAFQYTSAVDTLVVRFLVDGGPQAQQIGIWQLAGCST